MKTEGWMETINRLVGLSLFQIPQGVFWFEEGLNPLSLGGDKRGVSPLIFQGNSKILLCQSKKSSQVNELQKNNSNVLKSCVAT